MAIVLLSKILQLQEANLDTLGVACQSVLVVASHAAVLTPSCLAWFYLPPFIGVNVLGLSEGILAQ